ncbi:hypothetical protein A7J57_08110 [Agrobacterium tumefaciens]|uniref:Uncharacterized protein n=1 Tax=Agrobacterium tumefaciens TaxID=358 RepID=A0A176WY92_AGRTU|nr:hypothetical protein A7J57_08110 [Agrobacterium tumefaciens]
MKAAKGKKTDEWQAQTFFDAAAQPEVSKRQGEDDADRAGEQAMRPLPPEDRFELVKRHALVDFLILGDALVELEFLFPLGDGKRRNGAVDRLPLGDGQAGFGEPRRPADEN